MFSLLSLLSLPLVSLISLISLHSHLSSPILFPLSALSSLFFSLSLLLSLSLVLALLLWNKNITITTPPPPTRRTLSLLSLISVEIIIDNDINSNISDSWIYFLSSLSYLICRFDRRDLGFNTTYSLSYLSFPRSCSSSCLLRILIGIFLLSFGCISWYLKFRGGF